ncbi:MAG: hypothetical protein ACFHWX_20335 [Bacteroidota bacterium]
MNKLLKVFVHITLFSLIISSANGQTRGINEIAINIGGGHLFSSSNNVSQANYFTGNIQAYFLTKGNFSFGLQAGSQLVIIKQLSRPSRWGSQIQPYQNDGVAISPPLYQPMTYEPQKPDVLVFKHSLWHLLMISKYRFENNIILEGSLGTIAFIDSGDPIFTALVGLGAGYEFKITPSLAIPVKFKADYAVMTGMEDGNLRLYGPIYGGLTSGIIFRPGK